MKNTTEDESDKRNNPPTTLFGRIFAFSYRNIV